MSSPYGLAASVFLMNYASNAAADISATQAELEQHLQVYLKGGPVPNAAPGMGPFAGYFNLMNPVLAGGDWRVVWGPCVYCIEPDKQDRATNSMYVAYSPSLATYVVAIAATNAESLYDWVAEDGDVAPEFMAAWPLKTPFLREKHAPFPPAQAAISAATALGVSDLETRAEMRDPATGLDIRAYLKSVENPDATLIFSGHSLAGALSPTLAFHLYPDPAGSGWAKVHTLPTAGATPGNAAFVEAWTKAYPATPADSGFNWNTDYANAHDVVPHAWNNLSKAVQPIDLLLQHHSFWGVMDFELGGGLRTLVEGAEQLSGGVYQNLLQQFFEPDWGTWDWKQNSDGSWQYPPQWVPLKAFTALHPMRTLAELGAMIQATHVEQYPHFFGVIPGPRMPSSKPPSTEPAIDRG